MKKMLLVAATLVFIGSCSKKEDVAATPAPTVDFSYSGANVNAPATVAFSSTVTNTVTYLWDFGDNAVSADANPIHNYNAGGSYLVKLTVTGAGGSTSITKIVIINSPTSVKILGVRVTSIPFTDPSSGGGWDNNSGPDVYFNIDDANNTTISSSISSPYNNVTASSLPLPWTLNTPLVINNFSSIYNIRLYDQDTNDFPPSPDDFMGGYQFTFQQYTTQGYPTTITLQNTTSLVKIELTVAWQ